MILRLFIAIVGAGLITVSILFMMSEFTTAFRQRDGERFFMITDILPRPDPGRPERPPAAALPPAREALELQTGAVGIAVEAPAQPDSDLSIDAETLRPTLEDAGEQ